MLHPGVCSEQPRCASCLLGQKSSRDGSSKTRFDLRGSETSSSSDRPDDAWEGCDGFQDGGIAIGVDVFHRYDGIVIGELLANFVPRSVLRVDPPKARFIGERDAQH
jgi:hypothetical protein